MAVELATGYVSLSVSAKGLGDEIGKSFGNDLDKHANDAGDRAGRGFTDKFKVGLGGLATAVGGAFAAVQVGSFLKDSVGAASDLGESLSKVNIVFEDGADEIIDWSKTAAGSLGQSQQQALEAAGTYGNLFRAMGIGTDTSADMSKSLVGLAGDLASFNNASPEDVLLALRSGLSGEAEPLKQFGVNLNEARIQAEALRLGLGTTTVDQGKLATATEQVDKSVRKSAETLAKFGAGSVEHTDAVRDQEQAEANLAKTLDGKTQPLDAAAKAQAAYSLILADTSLAQGDFERTSGGLANQSRILAAKFEDLKAKIGTALLPVVQSVVSFLADKGIPAFERLGAIFQESVLPKLKEFGGFLKTNVVPVLQTLGQFIVANVVPALQSMADVVIKVFGFLNDHRELLAGLGVALGVVAGAILVGLVPAFLYWAINAAAAAVATIAAAAPLIAIALLIGALAAGIIWAYQNVEFFRVAVDAVASFLRDVLWPVIKTVADVIKDALIAQFQATIEVAQKVWEAIKTVADFLGPVLKAQIAVGVEGVKTLIGWFAAIIDAAVNVHNSATEKFEALVGFITGLPGRISSAASGMFDGIWDAFRGVYNSIADAWNNLSFELPSVDTKIPGIGTIGGFTIRPPFDIPRLASGAVASSPMLAMIGERGREIVAPDGLIRKIVREETAAGGATFNNTFNGTRVNARDVSDEIAWQLRGIL